MSHSTTIEKRFYHDASVNWGRYSREETDGDREYLSGLLDIQRDNRKLISSAGRKIARRAAANLNNEEICAMYAITTSPIDIYGELGRDFSIRDIRGERDRDQLADIIPDTVREQLRGAYDGYRTASKQLGIKAISAADSEASFDIKDVEWKHGGVYNHIVNQFLQDGVLYELLATPNIKATPAEIVDLARKFGKVLGSKLVIDGRDIYRPFDIHEQLWSGYDDRAGDIRWGLIPQSHGRYGYERGLNQWLERMKSKQAELNPRVPSMMDSVVGWYALRAQAEGRTLPSGQIQHFDHGTTSTYTPWNGAKRRNVVPSSGIDTGGRPFLGFVYANQRNHNAKVAIG